MQRLSKRPQFQAALAGGIVSRTAHFALHRLLLDRASAPSGPVPVGSRPLFDADVVWMGALVPKRWARRAVTRNAIRRQIYNVSDAFEASLAPAAHVVRLRSGFDRRRFVSASSDLLKRAVRTELEELFGRMTGAGREPSR